MFGLEGFGRILIMFGLFLLVLGGIFMVGGKLFGLGRLPGDILFQRGNFTFYFPLATSILLSLLLTIVLNLLFRR